MRERIIKGTFAVGQGALRVWPTTKFLQYPRLVMKITEITMEAVYGRLFSTMQKEQPFMAYVISSWAEVWQDGSYGLLSCCLPSFTLPITALDLLTITWTIQQ